MRSKTEDTGCGCVAVRMAHSLPDEHCLLDWSSFTGVTFIVQGEEIKGHKVLTASQSGVLQDLIRKNPERVDLGDQFSPKTFKKILRYFSSGEVHITERNIFELLLAATTISSENLERLCAEYVLDVISPFNVGELTKQALLFNSKELLKTCVEYFGINTRRVIEAKEFLGLPEDVLRAFCDTDRIDCPVTVLFSSCVKWAGAKCRCRNLQETPENLRTVLGEVLNKLPFTRMTKDDFQEMVVSTNILPDDEVRKILLDMKENARQKKENESLPCHRPSTVKVTLSCWSDHIFDLPQHTTIGELKRMKIWDSGRKRFSPKLFTLGLFKDKELPDDATLSSIQAPREDIHLEPYSITVSITDDIGSWTFPFTLNLNDFWQRSRLIAQVVRARLHSRMEKMSLEEPIIWWPGDIITVLKASANQSSKGVGSRI